MRLNQRIRFRSVGPIQEKGRRRKGGREEQKTEKPGKKTTCYGLSVPTSK